jgi:hypothetical protein
VSGSTFNIKGPQYSAQVQNVNLNAGTYEVKVTANAPTTLTKVRVPVWCKDNQSDIYWYNATKQSDGSFVARVSMANHKNDAGQYKTHIYGTGTNNVERSISVNDQAPNFSTSGTTTATLQGDEKNFNINTTMNTLKDKISKVEVAVWSIKNGQDDLKWYTATRNGADWSYSVPISNHKTSGKYYADTYVTLANGQRTWFKTSTFSISDSSIKVATHTGNGVLEVKVTPTNPSGISKVQVPVWSVSKGQDDLKWYDAVRQADGSYVASVNLRNHNVVKGDYTVHVYVTAGNGVVNSMSAGNIAVDFSDGLTLPGVNDTQKKWLNSVLASAVTVARANNLYPSVMLSQAIAESAWGTGELAKNANNFFGIKADASWKGAVYEKNTQEWDGSKYITVKAKFRKYSNVEQSFQDYATKIRTTKNGTSLRYTGVWRENAKTFSDACHALQNGGYATSPTYAQNLIDRINKYRLYTLD